MEDHVEVGPHGHCQDVHHFGDAVGCEHDAPGGEALVRLLVLLEGRESLRQLQHQRPQLELGEGLLEEGALDDLLAERFPGILPERVDAEVVGAEALFLEVLDPCIGSGVLSSCVM